MGSRCLYNLGKKKEVLRLVASEPLPAIASFLHELQPHPNGVFNGVNLFTPLDITLQK